MKKITIFSASIAALLCLSACSEKALEVFGNEHYVHFTEDQTKEYRFTFATAAPGTKEHTMKIPMELIGRELENDLDFAVEVVTTGDLKTTAAASDYSLGKTTFHKGVYKDSLNVTLKNSASLTTEQRLTLKLVANDNFLLGPANNRVAVIYFSNMLTKPSWWAGTIETTFLGEYSDLKYQHFIVATGVTDLENVDTMMMKALTTTFVYYLRDLSEKGTPAYESDGVTTILATVPYNKFV